MSTFTITATVNASPAEMGDMQRSADILQNRAGGGLAAAGLEPSSVTVSYEKPEPEKADEKKAPAKKKKPSKTKE